MLSEPMPRAPSPFTKHKGTTPVPTRQILCLLALSVAEPIHATQIQPYLPQVYPCPLPRASVFSLLTSFPCVAYRRDRHHRGRYEQSGILLGSHRMPSWLPILSSSQVLRQDTTFFFTEAIFVLQWARISDQIGRRPVLLMGVTGITISATCFGLSNTFQALVFSRALAGVLNANFAVLRGAMAEILDPSNFARTIAWLPIMWSAGATIGSVDRAYMWS